MHTKQRSNFGVALVLLATVVALNSSSLQLHDYGVVALTHPQERELKPQLDRLLRNLRFGNESERSAAKDLLIDLSKKSASARAQLIENLLKLIQCPSGSAGFVRNPTLYLEWKQATELVGLIKAQEAIYDLIQCLDFNNGVFLLSPDAFPATRAVIEIGEEAIPNLSREFRKGTTLRKYLAAVALSQMGGEKARVVLEAAARTEKDRELALTFRNFLENWQNSKTSKSQ